MPIAIPFWHMAEQTEMAHIGKERKERDLTRDGDGGAVITQRSAKMWR